MSKTDRYPNGYKEKLDYWAEKRDSAVLNNRVDDYCTAVDKLEYFTQRQIEWHKAQPNVLKFWCESSYDFEDKERKEDEALVIAVDMGPEQGTKTIGEMTMESRDTVETLLCIINLERFGS